MASNSTRRSRQVPFYGWVCEYCLEANPWNTQLLTTKCSSSHKCPIVPVHVAINLKGMLEQIRSLPKRLPRGRFVRCKTAGKCRYGGNCRYAHSEAEQEAWNAQLASTSSSDSKIGSAFKVLSQPKQKRKKSYSQQHIPQLLPQGRDYPRGRSKRRLFSESSANSGNDYQLSPHYVHPGREPQVHPYVPPVVESIPTLNAVHTVTPTLDTMSDTPPEEAEEWPSLSPATTPVVYVQLRRHSSTKEDGITPLTWPLATAATPDPSVPVHTNQSSPQAHIATQDLDEIQRHFPALFGSSSPSHQPLENPRQLSSSSVSVQSSSGTRTMAVSRLNEYEVNDVIGKGGFGVVFHVKNNTDECEYALKIIRLSDNLKKQEKVLREVRALAKLKGPHIVRYYNSWMEKAPDGWREKELWSMLKSSDSLPLIPVTTAMGSTPTTPSSTHTTNTSTSTHVVSSDLSQSVFGLTSHTADSVVSFRDSANSPPAHSQAVQPLITETDVNAKFPEIQLANPLDPPTCLFIQTELCQRDTLRTWLGKNCEENSRPKIKVMNYFKQILEALVYIHGEKFVHRDLKPSNIFFSCSEDRLKIGDFGLARKTMTIMHGGLAPTGVDTTNHGSADSHSKGSMQAGTALYMSPEQVKGENCDEKSDMFALGIILFELHYIMEARNQVLTALRNLEFPPKFEENHLNVTRIVKLLLAENPAERPTADELTKNKYLKNLAKKAKKSKSVGLTL